MAEPEPFCEACQLPLVMCIHRVPVTRRAVGEAVTVGVDWDAVARREGLTWDEIEGWPEQDGPVIEASYGGTCPRCGCRIEPGEDIQRDAAEDQYGHVECPETEEW